LDLNQVLTGTEKMLRRLIGADIELDTVLASDLGLVYEDPSQVEQVILNLAVNARDAMPGGGRLTLETANVHLPQGSDDLPNEVEPGPYVMLRVTDSGCGMDKATCSRIFEPFFTTKEQGRGTGLGLSTVYGIVTQGRGHIAVESEVGRGTIFKIFFPSAELKDVPDSKSRLPDTSLRGSETILLVEDDDSVRQTAARILRDHGYTVLEAREGKEAFGICENHSDKIDLLVTDVVMPEMSGDELSDLVASTFPEIKVLFMSGYAKTGGEQDPADRERLFIQKPLIPDELARKVRVTMDEGRGK
jgi:CheY-like chemotaxis protein